MTLTDIVTEVLRKLAGLTVAIEGNASYPVQVVAGVPAPDFFTKVYPLFSVGIVGLLPNYERSDNLSPLFGFTGSAPYTASQKTPPIPYDVSFQVDIWSRLNLHADQMTAHAALALRRSSYLEIGSRTLAVDVAEDDTTFTVSSNANIKVGDYLVLDNRIYDGVGSKQTFIVLGVSGPDQVTVEPAANRAYAAATTLVYEARLDCFQQDGMVTDSGQDAARPYIRRTFVFSTWAYLDAPPTATPYVIPGGMNLSLTLASSGDIVAEN